MKPKTIAAYDVDNYLTSKAAIKVSEKSEKYIIDPDSVTREELEKAVMEVASELQEQECLAKTTPFETSDGRTIQFLFFDKLPEDYAKYAE